MAMLAEKRERKRYNLVPRGKALYEDDNRFGTRMLEKMGWKKGNGLGARQDGEKDFIRIRYKHDNEGLGFEDRNDQWTQHETDFDGLLKSLTNEGVADVNSQSSNEDTPVAAGFGFSKDSDTWKIPSITGESLEEKSKKSRARVHYKKFTRGKDISQYSEKDLANIFGRKSLIKPECEQPLEEDDQTQIINTSQEMSNSEGNKEASFGVITISSGTSINDYFKAKLAVFRQKLTTNENSETLQGNKVANAYDNEAQGKSFKKAKKRMHKDASASNEVQGNGEQGSIESEVNDIGKTKKDQEKSCKKAKKRKHKDLSESNEVQGNDERGSVEDEVSIVNDIGKTKKKSAKCKGDLGAAVNGCTNYNDIAPQTESLANVDVGMSKLKSKLKRLEQNSQNIGCLQGEQVVLEIAKKRKSGKKDKSTCVDPIQLDENTAAKPHSEVDTKAEKEKSKHKGKSFQEANCFTETELEHVDIQRKRQKLKKSSKEEDLSKFSGECGADITPVTEMSVKDQDQSEGRLHKKSKISKKEKQISSVDLNMLAVDNTDCLATKKVKKSKKSKRKSEEPDPSNDVEKKFAPAGSNESVDSQHAKESVPPPTHSIETQQVHTNSLSATLKDNQFRFPELISRKRKKKSNQDTIDAPENTGNEDETVSYKISSLQAEKFSMVNTEGFIGSNFPLIPGYGLNGRINIEIYVRRDDALKIEKWRERLEALANNDSVRKRKKKRTMFPNVFV